MLLIRSKYIKGIVILELVRPLSRISRLPLESITKNYYFDILQEKSCWVKFACISFILLKHYDFS
jgi:hypothetical protein